MTMTVPIRLEMKFYSEFPAKTTVRAARIAAFQKRNLIDDREGDAQEVHCRREEHPVWMMMMSAPMVASSFVGD
ncbi:hypothetical protein NPIL_622271 [Nephila pilipes]|uniref:Uncharacterized protein n=1 Tax=Nephila pilipes TaxID=299642 RepID=A0A8X6UMG3_NEPPI|nr:hypothetical protein NPIL_622271 [Nephila pilipes]